jgi:hypothetical protein
LKQAEEQKVNELLKQDEYEAAEEHQDYVNYIVESGLIDLEKQLLEAKKCKNFKLCSELKSKIKLISTTFEDFQERRQKVGCLERTHLYNRQRVTSACQRLVA